MNIKQPGSRPASREKNMIEVEQLDVFTEGSGEFLVGRTIGNTPASPHQIVNIPIDFQNSNLSSIAHNKDVSIPPSVASV